MRPWISKYSYAQDSGPSGDSLHRCHVAMEVMAHDDIPIKKKCDFP